MMHRRRVDARGVAGRLSDATSRTRGWPVLAACALMVALSGATCWQWAGAQARTLTLEQAFDAAVSGDHVATRAIYLRVVEARARLEQLAQRDDDVGARARQYLQLLTKR